MVTINSNYAASFAANAAKQTQNSLNGAMEKLLQESGSILLKMMLREVRLLCD